MPEEKRRVNAAIDIKLYENVMKLGYTISEAITLGLQRLLEPEREAFEEADTNTPDNTSSLNTELLESLKNHVSSLESQLKIKDKQIEDLNERMHEQAVNFQTTLSQKAIEAPGAKKQWWKIW